MPTKEELEKQVAALERKVAKLQAQLNAAGTNAPVVTDARSRVALDGSPVFGANAVPLEQR